MKKIFLIISIWTTSIEVTAQQSKIDSLRQVLQTQKEDTNKINTLNALSRRLRQSGDYDEGKKYANEALLLSQSVPVGNVKGWPKGEANAYNNKGMMNQIQGNSSEALKNYSNCLRISQEIGYKVGEANAYNNIGLINQEQGNYSEALKNHLAALKISEEIGFKRGIANAYQNIGDVYSRQNNYAEGLKNYFSALKIMEEIGNKSGVAFAYGNIGDVFNKQGNYPEALKNNLAALKIREEIGDKRGIGTSYNNIGNMYGNQGNNPQAIKNHLASLKIQEEIGDKQGVAISYVNIGEDYSKQKKFTDALQYLKKGLSLAKELDLKDVVQGAYSGLTEASSGMNDYKKAYEYHQLYSDIKDTLFNEESSKQTAQIKEQYESEKKDAQIALLNKDNQLKTEQACVQRIIKNVFITGFALLLFITFLFINRLRLRQTLKLQMIRNKIAGDLHDDVGSTLSSIAIFSELANEEVKEKSAKASALLFTINENARSTIESMSDVVWAINPENDRFKNILQRMRTFASGILEAKHIDLKFEASSALSGLKLSMDKRKNLYLLFKEAVNNVAKYSAGKNCTIKLWLEGKILNMEIADDGIGFDMNDHIGGNGLLNMRKRSEEMNGEVSIHSIKENGTTIQLSFLAT